MLSRHSGRSRWSAIPKRGLCSAAECARFVRILINPEGVDLADTNTNALEVVRHRPMGFPEFVIVIATIMSLNPLAMDMMLPALPEIGSAIHVDLPNRLQMVLSTFLIGFGVGQFAIGPLSDSFGRRPVLLGGMVLYGIASLLALAAPSFETLLLARALEGLG